MQTNVLSRRIRPQNTPVAPARLAYMGNEFAGALRAVARCVFDLAAVAAVCAFAVVCAALGCGA